MLRLFVANLKMMSRDTQTIFFALLFPLGFTMIMGLATKAEIAPVKVALVQVAQDQASVRVADALRSDPNFDVIEMETEAQAKRAFEESELDGVLVVPDLSQGGTIKLIFDERGVEKLQRLSGRVSAFIEQQNLVLAGAERKLNLEITGLRDARRLGSFDYVLPGILLFAIMFSTVVGTGTAVAKNRELKIFKRMRATPFRPSAYMVAEIASRATVALIQMILVLVIATRFYDSQISGNPVWLAVIVLMGAAIFISIGFVVGSVARSVDAAGGLSTLVTLPLFFISGTIGSADSMPRPLQVLADYLPLNPLVDAMRTVILDGTSPFTRPKDMLTPLAWMIGTLALGASVFRFSDIPERRKAK